MANHSQKFLDLVNEVKSNIKECSIEDIKNRKTRGENFLLIDVREDHEWSAGHIPGAQHLGKGIIERDIENLVTDQTKEIILYCGGGFRSALAAYNLQKMGYKNVISMDGGFRGWKEAGLKIES